MTSTCYYCALPHEGAEICPHCGTPPSVFERLLDPAVVVLPFDRLPPGLAQALRAMLALPLAERPADAAAALALLEHGPAALDGAAVDARRLPFAAS